MRSEMTILPFLFLILSLPILVTSQSQRSILLSIKQQWGNPPALASWNTTDTTASPCSWQGVQCSDSVTVTGISLPNANIKTDLPPSICNLKNLTHLDLSWNYLPGTFPSSLYNCSALTYLDLSENLFVGAIPDDIGRLSPSLQYLNLMANNFTGDVPKSIGELKELTTLNLKSNLLNGTYPPEIGNLSKLETLVLAYNPFAEASLPPEIGSLKNLKLLWMSDCNLVGEIPTSFEKLSSLEHLDLIENRLVGVIPKGLFLIKNLTYVYLFQNSLSGEIPSSVEAMNLTEIDLSQNKLTGLIPQGFGELKELRNLNLYQNRLTGGIPEKIGMLPNLEVLKLFTNNLNGALPAELGLHSKLQRFEIGDNRLSGPLPENLCSGGAFVGVTAFDNNLNGEIPKSLANCKSLLSLQLYNNSFTGEIPSGIWTLPKVYSLQLSFNNFSGQLPQKLSWNMTRLEIDNNNFSGQLPRGIATWTNLRVFSAGNNHFSGSVPTELTTLSTLTELNLQGNQLSGELPTELSSLTSLSKLDLSRNHLSGSIPSSLGSVYKLNYLDLSTNDLSGKIPSSLEKLTLTNLYLSNNKLTGEIPDSLDNSAFENGYSNNSGLCTSKQSQISTLPKCSSPSSSESSSHRSSSKRLAVILVMVVVIFLGISYFTYAFIQEVRKARQRRRAASTDWKLTSFQKLDFTEKAILSSLSDHNVVGSGGSGTVYRVPLNRAGGSVLAVKRIWCDKEPNEAQFLAEVEILGTVRHSNIVKLLCCVSSDESKLLVYEYMENESLDKWIHTDKRRPGGDGSGRGVLDWPTRLRIAIGAAQGLKYMHDDCSPPIVHRDVKSSNILLDSEFNAKVADFGLAKILSSVQKGEPKSMSAVAGSFGYLAPEYRYTTKVNEKVDVYSFGVVLLELTTGKKPNGEDDTLNLADWSWKHYTEDRPIIDALDKEAVDAQQCYVEEMTKVFKLGLLCTSTLPTSRPSMKEVLSMLNCCSSLNDVGWKPKTVQNERDYAPLLGSETYLSTYENDSSQRSTEEVGFNMV